MKKSRRLILSAAAMGLFGLALLPASASANVQATPTALNFPSRQVATESDPQTVTVLVFCTVPGVFPNCAVNDTFTPNPSFTGANPGDFSQTNTCGAGVTAPNGVAPGVCLFTVRFKPTAPGARAATLTLGTNTVGTPPPPISLTGSAVAAPVTAPPATTPPAKKCKKGKKKKCKKKKK